MPPGNFPLLLPLSAALISVLLMKTPSNVVSQCRINCLVVLQWKYVFENLIGILEWISKSRTSARFKVVLDPEQDFSKVFQ